MSDLVEQEIQRLGASLRERLQIGQIGKFLKVPYSPVINTTRDTVLGKFTGRELVFTTSKNTT